MTDSFEWPDLDRVLATFEALGIQGKSPATAGWVLARHLRDSLGVRGVVAENEYVDADYSRAYQVFYGAFFRPPAKFCTRYHFFSREVPAAELPDESWQDHYLGFVVLWPTDPSVIGRSVLLAAPGASPALELLAPVSLVHLGAHEFRISAPPFATKDFGVAACATVATWLATEISFGLSNLPRSSSTDITLLATDGAGDHGRPLPQRFGLTPGGIAHALHALGYSPFVYDFEFTWRAVGTMFGYLASGIPPILMLEFLNGDRHAVVAVGYRFDQSKLVVGRSFAEGVTELVVHDDRYGPYISMKVDSQDDKGVAVVLGYPDGHSGEAFLRQLVVPLPPLLHTISQEAHIWGVEMIREMAHQKGALASADAELPFVVRTKLVDSVRVKSESLDWGFADAASSLQRESLPRRVWLTEALQLPLTSEARAIARVVIDATVLRDATKSKYLWAHHEETVFA